MLVSVLSMNNVHQHSKNYFSFKCFVFWSDESICGNHFASSTQNKKNNKINKISPFCQTLNSWKTSMDKFFFFIFSSDILTSDIFVKFYEFPVFSIKSYGFPNISSVKCIFFSFIKLWMSTERRRI